MAPQKVIGTHSGSFHADEATACAMLYKYSNDFKNGRVVRSRDPSVWETTDILVDVGAEYIPEKHRYDHHQRGFDETFDDKHSIKLSSAGLVYKHFGREIVANVLGWSRDDPRLEEVYQRVYTDFIEGLDGNDNGVAQYPIDIRPAYKDRTSLPARVDRLNPSWNEKVTPEKEDERFKKAMSLCHSEFVDCVEHIALEWLPARDIVREMIDKRYENHSSGEIVVVGKFCPWKKHLLELEPEMHVETPIKYVIYPDSGEKWRVQCVPASDIGFENRRSLPEAWRGLRDADLSEVSGIDGCVFVHAAGFIGGNQTFDGALSMAIKALKLE
eukprot:Clim_evm7s204 gene=Clim_evmTU7s204